MPAPASSRARLIIWLGIPLFAVVIIVSASALIWEVRTIALLQERNASLSRENGQLLRRIDDLTRTPPALAGQPPSPAARAPRPEPDAATAEALAAETQQTVSDLENIFRRREIYLNNILRRYREITEQYRARSGVQDGRGRAANPLSSAEISRIQNSLDLAEDDLKQLTALSAQAQRLQKKLPVK